MLSHVKNSPPVSPSQTRTLANGTVVISDVHLGGFDPATNADLENDFLKLLDWCQSREYEIILLGDIFDYYMQYGSYVPDVCTATFRWFTEYHKSRSSPGTLFITGNHDNWDDGALKQAGFDPEQEYRLAHTIDGRQVMLMHGDGLIDTQFSFPRPVFHRVLRNPYFVTMFKMFTNGKTGNELMSRFSTWSRNNDDGRNDDKKLLDFHAKRILRTSAVDVLICGHHHEMRDVLEGDKRYLNTGAFFTDRTICLYTNGSFELVRWDGRINTVHKLM